MEEELSHREIGREKGNSGRGEINEWKRGKNSGDSPHLTKERT